MDEEYRVHDGVAARFSRYMEPKHRFAPPGERLFLAFGPASTPSFGKPRPAMGLFELPSVGIGPSGLSTYSPLDSAEMS